MSIWQGFLANLALSAIMLLVWDFVGYRIRDWSGLARGAAFGVIAALGILASMMQAIPIVPGVIVDLRLALIATTSFFGGPVTALIGLAAALAYRIHLGGVGVPFGVVGMALAAFVGLGLRIATEGRQARHADVVLLAGIVSLIIPALSWILPSQTFQLLASEVIFPQMVATLVGSMLVGFGLLHERQRNELFRSNETFRAMVEALPDCLNVKSIDGRFIIANEATAEFMQAGSAAALIGRTDADFYEESVAAGFRADEERVLRQGRAETLDQPFTRQDGSSGWLSTLKAPLRDEHGQIVGIITHNRDITESRRLRAELGAVNERFEDALRFMADGIVMFDAEGRIELRNDRYAQLFPATADVRVPGARFVDILKTAALRGEEIVATPDLESWAEKRALELHTYRDRQFPMRDGRWLEARTRPVRNGRTLITIADISDSKRLEQRLEHEATHDTLTGLANRAMLQSELSRRFEAAVKAEEPLAVLLIDLDRFKEVNDHFGHAVGDTLLKEVARRIEAALREGDLVARLGGDEFAVLMSGPTALRGAESLAERILGGLSRSLKVGNVELLPFGSIGIAYYPKDAESATDLMIRADRALYAAKGSGRGRYAVYKEERDGDRRNQAG